MVPCTRSLRFSPARKLSALGTGNSVSAPRGCNSRDARIRAAAQGIRTRDCALGKPHVAVGAGGDAEHPRHRVRQRKRPIAGCKGDFRHVGHRADRRRLANPERAVWTKSQRRHSIPGEPQRSSDALSRTAFEVGVEDDLVLLDFVGTDVRGAARHTQVRRAALVVGETRRIVAFVDAAAAAQ